MAMTIKRLFRSPFLSYLKNSFIKHTGSAMQSTIKIKPSMQGFTLLELMITVAIAAILLGIGIPSFIGLVNNNRLTSTTNDFITAINTTRVEAIRQGQRVTLCPSTNNTSCGGTWESGWIIFNDINHNAVVDNGETILHTGSATPTGIVFGGTLPDVGGYKYISYASDSTAKQTGGGFLAATISILSNGQFVTNKLRCITINNAGRISVKALDASTCS